MKIRAFFQGIVYLFIFILTATAVPHRSHDQRESCGAHY